MTKEEFREYIKRQLGHPYIKTEISNDQLDDCINRAKSMFTLWAVGNATQEVFFTLPLSGGERHYTLPDGITEIIDMKDTSDNFGDANQLFTTSNYMLNAGMLNFLNSGQKFSMVSYHLGLDFLDMLNKYSTSDFTWKYHKYDNTLTISPIPSATSSWSDISNNFMLVRSYMKEGYDLDGTNEENVYFEYIYEEPWIQEYSIALAKIILGQVRRKFGGYQSIGNTGISLDGSELVQEGKEEKAELEERLKSEEVHEGFPIFVG